MNANELSDPFKRGEGYFALKNVKDSSGFTIISHPKANLYPMVRSLYLHFELGTLNVLYYYFCVLGIAKSCWQ